MSDQESAAAEAGPIPETGAMADITPPAADASTPPPPPAITTDRVLDVLLGAAAVTAESLRRAADQVRAEAPSVIAALEEKGRPWREQLMSKLAFPDKSADSRGENLSEMADTAETGGSAEDEISALERRVQELEQQVVTESAAPAASAAPETPAVEEPTLEMPTASDVASDEHTPAEEATFVYGDETPPVSLADSSYAVSETTEEVAREKGSDEEPSN